MAELAISKKYYNTLYVEGFSRMMKDPSYCYKFYWLEAIVILISENKKEATYHEIIDEMIANAWYSVLEFHVHLSGVSMEGQIKDNLEKAVCKLFQLSGLSPNASKTDIKDKIHKFENSLHMVKMELTKNVPIKALSGFANVGNHKISLDSSMGRMMEYYNKINETSILLPYVFGNKEGLDRKLTFNEEWIQMIEDHTVTILGWIQLEKVKWLQKNNPEIPGLVYKLAPMDEKMRKLTRVRALWESILEFQQVIDIFKATPIEKEAYEMDHFIPWSFVMNDELWNLMPMDSTLNSSKNNRLPSWKPFFQRFVFNQYIMYKLIFEKETIRKLYEACYRDNLHSIWANQELYRRGNTKEEFYSILDKNMRPVYDSARRQGYEIWNLSTHY